MRITIYRLFPVAALALATSCLGPTDSKSGDKRPDGNQGAKAQVKLVPVTQPTVASALLKQVAGVPASTLESFQVAIGTIFLAKEVQLNGSGWSNPQGTFELYKDSVLQQNTDPNFFTAANAADASKDRFYVDFMTAAGREKLSQSAEFTSEQLGDYNWVVVNWAMPFRVRASAALGDGRTVYTKPGTTVYDSVTWQSHTYMSGDVMTGPAETAIAVKNNGGTLFRFLKPYTLTEEDLKGTKMIHDTAHKDSAGNVVDTLVPAGKLQVMLVFNPDEFLTAWDSTTADRLPREAELMGPNGVGNIKVPYLDATAVPFREGEEVWRETYIFLAANDQMPGDSLRCRFEVYSVGDNVVAVNTRALTGPQGEFPVEAVVAFFVKEQSGGTLRVEDSNHDPIVDGFHRLGTAGETGHADLTLSMIHAVGAPYTLVEKRKMN